MKNGPPSKKFRRVHPHDIEAYSAVHMAVLINVGYVTEWPHLWTRDGSRSVRRWQHGERGYNGFEVICDACRILSYSPKNTFGPSVSPRAQSIAHLRNLNADYQQDVSIDQEP